MKNQLKIGLMSVLAEGDYQFNEEIHLGLGGLSVPSFVNTDMKSNTRSASLVKVKSRMTSI